MATAPGTPATTRPGRTIHLSELLKRPITDSRGESLGRVEDVVVRLPGDPLPVVKGLVAKVGGREVFIPVEQAGVFDGEELKLTSPRIDLRRCSSRCNGHPQPSWACCCSVATWSSRSSCSP